MKKLINSLNKEQQTELVALLKRNPALNQQTALIIEDHLSGNSTGFNEMFNQDKVDDVPTALTVFLANAANERKANNNTTV